MKNLILIMLMLLPICKVSGQPSVVWSRTYPDSVHGATIRDAIRDNSGNIIVAASTPNQTNLSNTDPIFIKYDPFGNLISKWVHADSFIDEIPTQIVYDSTDNLYVLTLTSGISQDTVHIIKVNGNTGQEIYNYALGTGIYAGAMGVDNQYLYVALGFPNLQLFKFDLQGNLIWNKPLTNFQRVKAFHFYKEYIYIIGDTISSPNFVDMIQKFDSSGNLQWQSSTLNAGSYNYTDSEIDSSGSVWITGYNSTNSFGYLSKIDSSGAVWDTLLGTSTFPDKISIDNQGVVFWAYIKSIPTSEICEVVKMDNNGNNLFASIDSADNQGNGMLGVDINCMADGSIMVANSHNVTFLLKDYEISNFDSNGNLNWNIVYSQSAISIEKVYRLFADTSFTFIVGVKKDSITGTAKINVLRIDYTTAINEPILNINSIEVFPNPTTENQVNFNEFLYNADIALYDCFGRLIINNINYSGNNLQLPQNLKTGIYFLSIANEKIIINKKILIN